MMSHQHTNWLRPIYLAFQGVFGGSDAAVDSRAAGQPPALLDKIGSMLLRLWDPLLIQEFPGASDQYDGYARDIHEMIEASASADDISDFLGQVQSATMGLSVTPEHNKRIAKRIMSAAGQTRGAPARQ